MSLVPFSFESREVRAVIIDGKPMFSSRDVALALGYANPAEAYKTHCKSLKKLSYSELLELKWVNPNPQGEYVMPESDAYRLIVRSEKPEAERFEVWLFEEVIPSIRKTGSYALPTKPVTEPVPVEPLSTDPVILQCQRAVATAKCWLEMGKLFGTDEPMSRAVAANQTKLAVGIDFSPLLPRNGVEDAEPPVNATTLGAKIGVSARKMNLLLEQTGMQTNDKNQGWVPTEKGKEFCTVNPFQSPSSAHTGYQVLWYPKVLEQVKPVLELVKSV